MGCCCTDGPKTTGFFRDGICRSGPTDRGLHIVCARVTDEFLSFSRWRGNDLVTPRPEFGFPGLRSGDRWCLCMSRWLEAVDAGCAPPILIKATHESALDHVALEVLKEHALDLEPEPGPGAELLA